MFGSVRRKPGIFTGNFLQKSWISDLTCPPLKIRSKCLMYSLAKRRVRIRGMSLVTPGTEKFGENWGFQAENYWKIGENFLKFYAILLGSSDGIWSPNCVGVPFRSTFCVSDDAGARGHWQGAWKNIIKNSKKFPQKLQINISTWPRNWVQKKFFKK